MQLTSRDRSQLGALHFDAKQQQTKMLHKLARREGPPDPVQRHFVEGILIPWAVASRSFAWKWPLFRECCDVTLTRNHRMPHDTRFPSNNKLSAMCCCLSLWGMFFLGERMVWRFDRARHLNCSTLYSRQFLEIKTVSLNTLLRTIKIKFAIEQ